MYDDHRHIHVLNHSFPTRRSSDLRKIEFLQSQFPPHHFWSCRSIQEHQILVVSFHHKAVTEQVVRARQHAVVYSECLLFDGTPTRSEEHTSELQSLMRNSYAVFCLNKKKHYRLHYEQLSIT